MISDEEDGKLISLKMFTFFYFIAFLFVSLFRWHRPKTRDQFRGCCTPNAFAGNPDLILHFGQPLASANAHRHINRFGVAGNCDTCPKQWNDRFVRDFVGVLDAGSSGSQLLPKTHTIDQASTSTKLPIWRARTQKIVLQKTAMLFEERRKEWKNIRECNMSTKKHNQFLQFNTTYQIIQIFPFSLIH